MRNILIQGYEIEREGGTKERYYGWNATEIRDLEKSRHNNYHFRIVCKLYEIENEFHTFTYDRKNCVFRDINGVTDEITEIETEYGIAGHLWKEATEADEDSVRAYKLMAVDIFGSFEKWRAMTFWNVMKEFERDVNYLKEVTK